MHPLRALLILTLALSSAACTTLAGPGGAQSLAGRTFLSASVTEGGAERPLAPGTQIRLNFGDDGNLGVNAGCNHIGATWRIAGGVLQVEGGQMTEMGCDPARHAQDDWVIAFLTANPGAMLDGSDLLLTVGDTVMRLTDREVADPDRPLVGPLWTVDTLIDGDTAASIAGDVEATLQFAADGNVLVSTGCNSGTTTVTEANGTLRFGPIALTKRACDGPAGDMERAVLAVLQADTIAWTVDANALSLQAAGRGLVLRAP
ncbi:MAG TPA: META domain-containing protein [Vitreimonas sp.]|nr:META domain-containing protein [Vitreimonas sp.]